MRVAESCPSPVPERSDSGIPKFVPELHFPTTSEAIFSHYLRLCWGGGTTALESPPKGGGTNLMLRQTMSTTRQYIVLDSFFPREEGYYSNFASVWVGDGGSFSEKTSSAAYGGGGQRSQEIEFSMV